MAGSKRRTPRVCVKFSPAQSRAVERIVAFDMAETDWDAVSESDRDERTLIEGAIRKLRRAMTGAEQKGQT